MVRLARWRILPYTESAIARVAQLKVLRLNVRLLELRIAAIPLETGAVVVALTARLRPRPRPGRRGLIGLNGLFV